MEWTVILHDAFAAEVLEFPRAVRVGILAHRDLLQQYGPALGRPHADTLNGSKYSNMKELRFKADDGVWRVAFAFDPERRAVLLVAGDKSGVSEKRFYKTLIERADERFSSHLAAL